MKKIVFILLIFALSLTVVPQTALANEGIKNIAFFVSPNGSDSNSGTIDSPFKTLEKARDTIRSLDKKEGSITVFLREGSYDLGGSFKLEEQDSGTTDCRITYRAYKNEKVNITGGASLPADKFQ